jgi:hypothetical protein
MILSATTKIAQPRKDHVFNSLLGVPGLKLDQLSWSNEAVSIKTKTTWQALSTLIEAPLTWKTFHIQTYGNDLMLEGSVCF